MKFIIYTILVCCLASEALAQEQDKILYELKAEKYKRMKNTGAALTVGGGVLAIVGIVVGSNSSVTTTSYGGGPTDTESTGSLGFSVAAFLIGGASVGVGVPLWIVGSKSEKKYTQKLENLSVKMNVRPGTKGLTLVYRL